MKEDSNRFFGLPLSKSDPLFTLRHNHFLVEYINFCDQSKVVLAVKERILKDELWVSFFERQRRKGSSYPRQFLKTVLMSWAWFANKYGEESANQKLLEFIEGGKPAALVCTLVYGVYVDKPIRITPSDELIPYSELPDYGPFSFLNDTKFMGPPNACLLVSEGRLGYYLASDQDLNNETLKRHKAIVLALCCTQDFRCAEGLQSVISKPDVIPGIFHQAVSTSSLQKSPFQMFSGLKLEGTSDEFDKYVDRISKEIDNESNSGLYRALKRFSKAKDQLDDADRVLDLGISLEMMLLSDDHGNSKKPDQLRLSFCLRGAKLLGGGRDERKVNYNLLKDIYSMRSQVAHNGKLEPKANLDAEHFLLGEKIIKKVLTAGLPKNWDDLLI